MLKPIDWTQENEEEYKDSIKCFCNHHDGNFLLIEVPDVPTTDEKVEKLIETLKTKELINDAEIKLIKEK